MTELSSTSARAKNIRGTAHPSCFVCAPTRGGGLQMCFVPGSDGSVSATFPCDQRYEGYPGVIHGGVVSSILDGAMTNCLFGLGRAAFTADLHVRFRHPVCTGEVATVRARLTRDASPLFVLEAEVMQGGQVKATAVGKFLEKEGLASRGAD